MIYSGHVSKIHDVHCEEDDDVKQFNRAADDRYTQQLQIYSPLNVTLEEFDAVCQSEWFMPAEYQNIDVTAYLIDKCKTTVEEERVMAEMREFKSRNMIYILRYMIYLVDFMRENDIVWGVGRGSSVASYVLFLIGVHRINSIQYNLDWAEFLR